jgi:hypothetical protein
MGTAWHVLINAAQHGRGMAWARHGMCELTRHSMAGEWHGRGMAFFPNYL